MKIVNGIVTELDGINFIKDLIPVTNKNARPGVKMTPEYITIHNTGNSGTSAAANSNYVDNQTGYVSWHFTVGPGEVYQEMPITEHAWHAGDGANGPGNRKSIGIEIAEVNGAEETAIKFVAQLLKATGLTIDRVVPHQHWSGKYCPRLILPHWDKFISDIQKILDTQIDQKQVDYVQSQSGIGDDAIVYMKNYSYAAGMFKELYKGISNKTYKSWYINLEITLPNASIILGKIGLEASTINYLKAYHKWGRELVIKLAKAAVGK